MKRAAAYYRVSTEIQDLDRQYSKVRDFAKKNEYDIVKEFEDHDSGANPNRTQFLELQKWVAENPNTSVIVAELDRAGRTFEAYLPFKAVCRTHNVEIRALNQVKTGSLDSDDLIEGIMLSYANFERSVIRNRFMGGRIAKLRAGIPIMGRAPFGYRYISNEGKENKAAIIINNEEAPWVIQIFEWFTQKGFALRQIARELAKRQVTSKRGGKWAAATVKYIIKNEGYATGTIYFHFNNEKIPIKIPTLIDQEVFDKAQKVLRLPKHKAPNKKYEYLLSGLIECGTCGKRYDAYKAGNGIKTYRCSNRSRIKSDGNYHSCKNPTANTKLDAIIWSKVLRILQQKAITGEQSIKAELLKTAKYLDDKEDKITKAVKALETRRDRAADAYLEEAITITKLKKVRSEVDSQLQQYGDQLEEIITQQRNINEQLAGKSMIKEARERATKHNDLLALPFLKQQEAVKAVIKRIVVEPVIYNYTVEYQLPYTRIEKLDESTRLKKHIFDSVNNV